MNPTKSKIALLATTATLAAGGMVATAQAEEVDVIGGETELKLDKSTAEVLAANDITAEGTTFEVKKGEFDFAPLTDGGGGFLKHRGTLTLESDEAKVKLKSLELDFAGPIGEDKPRAKNDSGVLGAKVDGEQIEIARLNTRNYESDEAEYSFEGLRASLSKQGAKALNAAFETDVFEQGIKLGKLSNQSEVS